MKNKDIGALKQAIYLMKFESFGEIKQAGNAVEALDKAMQECIVKQHKVFEDAGVKPTNGHYSVEPTDERIGKVTEGMNAIMDEDSGLDLAFMSEDQFNNAIKVREQIPTELLIIASKYLVK